GSHDRAGHGIGCPPPRARALQRTTSRRRVGFAIQADRGHSGRSCCVSADGRLRMNHDEVTGKVIDGEAVIINVVTGRYYSLEEASCVAWVHLTAGASTDDVVTAITGRYDADPDQVAGDLGALFKEL